MNSEAYRGMSKVRIFSVANDENDIYNIIMN